MENDAEDALEESMKENQEEEEDGKEAVTEEELEDVLGADDAEDAEELFPNIISQEVCAKSGFGTAGNCVSILQGCFH